MFVMRVRLCIGGVVVGLKIYGTVVGVEVVEVCVYMHGSAAADKLAQLLVVSLFDGICDDMQHVLRSMSSHHAPLAALHGVCAAVCISNLRRAAAHVHLPCA